MTQPGRRIQVNDFFYSYFLNKKILAKKSVLSENELIQRIECISRFAYLNHSGRYYDGRIENILLDIGQNLEINDQELAGIIEDFTLPPNSSTLHVATEIYKTGGHTRILAQIVKRNPDKNQVLLLTRQKKSELPEWFISETSSKLRIITLENEYFRDSYSKKALFIRTISVKFDRVILYVHPYDAIPVLSFTSQECPPILLENHAHSWFWLGSSIADIVFSHTEFHQMMTNEYRYAKKSILIELSQDDDIQMEYNISDKTEAKRKLLIDTDLTCITIIGNKSKFYPTTKEYNVFVLIRSILRRFKNVCIIVIGLNSTLPEIRKYGLDKENVRFVGHQPYLQNYYMASDICLDSIPEPSLGTTTMSAIIGLSCPLYKYGNTNVFYAANVFHSDLYNASIGRPVNLDEYLDKLGILINDPELRISIAREFRCNFVNRWSPKQIQENIQCLLKLSNDTIHQYNRLPENRVFIDENSNEIAEISHLRTFYDIIVHFLQYLSIKDILLILFSLSKNIGNFREILATISKLGINHFSFRKIQKYWANSLA